MKKDRASRGKPSDEKSLPCRQSEFHARHRANKVTNLAWSWGLGNGCIVCGVAMYAQ
jgi:hypothetical protein